MWDRAEADLRAALEANGLAYEVKEGEGAFYGPKIDVDIQDALGRPWQLNTTQLDFQILPNSLPQLVFWGPIATHPWVVMVLALFPTQSWQ